MKHLLAIALLATQATGIILRPNNPNATGNPIGMLFLPGAKIEPEQYKEVVKNIQQRVPRPMFVAIPSFIDGFPEPLGLKEVLEAQLVEMELEGFPRKSPLFIGGHSLGGAVAQGFAARGESFEHFNITGQVLMGAFITRNFRNSYTPQRFKSYAVPTLTIGGEMDGLCKVVRIIEQFYVQQQSFGSEFETKYPVVVIPGMSHMQFASGTIPPHVEELDLIPEISYEDAHRALSAIVGSFIQTRLGRNNDDTLLRMVKQTQNFSQPVIDGMLMEGSYHLINPCNCENLTCHSNATCQGGSPWTTQISQGIVAQFSSLPGSDVIVNNTDSFHPTYQVNPIHYANISNRCTEPHNCILQTSTVTQNCYEEHPDTGSHLQSAYEMRTKMKSKESFYSAVGVANVTENFHICRKVNEASLSWAMKRAGRKTLSRYQQHGEVLTTGEDIKTGGGPSWSFPHLSITRSCDPATHKNHTVVMSQYLYTPIHCNFVPEECGVHYCKVLSPAYVMEWLYVDSLRMSLSLANKEKNISC